VWPVQGVFEISVAPLFAKDKISGCLAVIHDITEIKKLEAMRRDFVANVSHELKTPLTSVKGFVETLLEGALSDKENSRHFLEIIREHTNRLDNLINDLLNLSYLESNTVELRKSGLMIRDLAEEVLSGFGSQLKKKPLKAKNEIPAGLIVSADKENLEQVLTNLIDNAIKFNRPQGSLVIRADDLGIAVKIAVEDTGSGIPAKDLPRIFERFYRVDKARSRELGGTGLGLSIVKHIVELHGGSVGAESTEGLGSKFWFTLPK
ncbi:MAG: ATP-binding protein, partial [Candidatus Omnitrophica bacterium]|nr:ATP-binding protein [Candidatus Omnitrophota bacterium]